MSSTPLDARLAGQVIHYGSAPRDFRMRIPDQAIRCVGFISHDVEPLRYVGSAFVVSVPSESGDGSYLHLVTARHVTDKIDPGPFVVALNGKNGRKVLLKSSDQWTWWHHPETPESVDVAVMPFATANLSNINVEWIPEKMFVTRQRMQRFGIGIGDEVNCVGLFTQFYGSSEFVPVVRSGIVAMLPRDPVPVRDFGLIEAVLVESRSIGGLSGSPVFVRHTVSLPPVKDAEGDITSLSGLGSLHFLGLIHGHWNADDKTAFIPEEAHSGLSIVVPANKISEVLHHPKLVKMRREFDEKEQRYKDPIADAAKPEQKQQEFTQSDFDSALKKVSRKVG